MHSLRAVIQASASVTAAMCLRQKTEISVVMLDLCVLRPDWVCSAPSVRFWPTAWGFWVSHRWRKCKFLFVNLEIKLSFISTCSFPGQTQCHVLCVYCPTLNDVTLRTRWCHLVLYQTEKCVVVLLAAHEDLQYQRWMAWTFISKPLTK